MMPAYAAPQGYSRQGGCVFRRIMPAAIRILVVALALTGSIGAQPNYDHPVRVGEITLFRDSRQSTVFHHLPGKLVLALNPDGAPDFHLLMMRYTGTAATGDQGESLFRNILSFQVRTESLSPLWLNKARRELGRNTRFRPVALSSLRTRIVYQPLSGDPLVTDEPPLVLTDAGTLESAASSVTSREATWTERSFTVSLEPWDADLLAQSLELGQVAFSLAWAAFVDAPPATATYDVEHLQASPELLRWFKSLEDKKQTSPDRKEAPFQRLVFADVLSFVIDSEQIPEVIRKIDLNEGVPPGYPVMEVRCYDFGGNRTPGLEEKQVEIEAIGIGGKPVATQLVFSRQHPDQKVLRPRFAYAVNMKRPFRYRILSVFEDGTIHEGSWEERERWSAVVDITSKPSSPFSL